MIQPEEVPAPLTPRVARGALWIVGSRFAGRVFDMLKALILARLLTPADFGLFGIVMLALTTLDTFSQTGMSAALVQRRGDIRPFIGTAWTIQIVRGIVLAVLLYLAAPAVAAFFNEPAVTGLLRFVTLVLLAQGLVSTGIVSFTRDLDFRRSFIFEVCSGGLSLVAGVILAYRMRSPWALVWANLVGAIARVVLSFLLAPIQPRLELKKEHASELFAFGKWMSGYAVATWFWQNIDRLVLGRVLGAGPLGVYQMAQRVAGMPVSEVAVASMGVSLPAYARIQNERERLARSFLDTVEMTMSVVAPLAAFLVLAAPDVVQGLLGEQWVAAVVPLQILSVGALFTALDAAATPLLVAVGKPKIEFWKNAARSAAVGLIIVPLTARYGVVGAGLSFVIGSLTALAFWGYAVRAASLRWRALAGRALLVGVMTAPVCVAVSAANVAASQRGAAGLALATAVAVSSWLAAGYALRGWADRGAFVHIARLKRAWAAAGTANPGNGRKP